ncbi:PREDICTED: sugar transporter ERD6-like 10 isoform X3 [Camelina sativa]|uniref:Sugar transporter ERD6-like 10 isoform X3 n=1 Tax=Camelina sativa TaxID=90675 RepID=A0ABM1RAW1_CAMSA|nr:PREDICTED: sugar transporter ERD6-like 10 isoform X3 [Camelina sativa]
MKTLFPLSLSLCLSISLSVYNHPLFIISSQEDFLLFLAWERNYKEKRINRIRVVMEEGLLLWHQNDRDHPRITTCVIFSTFVAVCSSFSYGCANGYTSGAETAIMKELDLSMAQTLWTCDLFCIFGWLSIAFAKNVFWLDLGRISLGIGVGLISYVVPVYIAEITPKHVRGAVTSSTQLLLNIGLSLVYFYGTVINWRILAIIGALPCFIQLIGIYFIPESPRWLAKVGSGKEVESSLHRLRGKDTDVSGESAEIQVMTKMLEEVSKSSFCDMFQKKYRRTLVIGIGLMLIQQLSGASGITFYSNAVFRKAGFSERLGSMIFGVFVASAVGISSGSLLLGVSFTLQVYFGYFAIGIGGLPWVIMSEQGQSSL